MAMAPASEVLIIGAGLGGLMCAIACRREGLDVTVLERAPQIATIGAGIQIPPNASRILDAYGLLPALAQKAIQLDSLVLRRYSDGEILCSKPLGDAFIKKHGGPWFVVHREDYLQVLLDEARNLKANIVLDAEVVKVDPWMGRAELKNGQIFSGKVIVGADGLWSNSRDTILGRHSPPFETGELAYRATVSLKHLQELNDSGVDGICKSNAVQLWMGPGKHCVFYPIRDGTHFNLVLSQPDDLASDTRVEVGNLEEMRRSFEGWDQVLQKILSIFPSALKWKLMHHTTLEKWNLGVATLLGDACHPTLPTQAQGAAMAVEDGAILGQLLGSLKRALKEEERPVPLDTNWSAYVPQVLKLYEDMRKRRTELNVEGAVANSLFYHMNDGHKQLERDSQMSTFDWEQGRSQYPWLDTQYQYDLLAHDSITEAKDWFDRWWLIRGDRVELDR